MSCVGNDHAWHGDGRDDEGSGTGGAARAFERRTRITGVVGMLLCGTTAVSCCGRVGQQQTGARNAAETEERRDEYQQRDDMDE